ncbi:MAG: hypothetical protein AB7V50_02365 [Vampirovibrionia bacterium]
MVRHSHHHVPAHIGGVRYVPPCCGCGGINRANLRRDNAIKQAKERAGLENLQNMQKAAQKEAVPQYVREMAGIKLKQQLSSDTVNFAKVLQQKGVSKEKALEKLLDKLVGMYTSEKELMKALKNMEMSKLMELLKKALTTVNESNLGEEETLKKNVKKTKDKGDIVHKKEIVEEEIENAEEKDDNNDGKNKKKHVKNKKNTKKNNNKSDEFEKESTKIDSLEEIETENTDQTTVETTSVQKIDTKPAIQINLDKNNIKLSGNSYAINAVNLLKEQEEIEINKVRYDKLYKERNKKSNNPLIKDSTQNDSVLESDKNKKDTKIEEKSLKELESENDKLKQLIMKLQKERRETLIAGIKND